MNRQSIRYLIFGAFVSLSTLTIHDARQQPVATSQSEERISIQSSVMPVIEPIRKQRELLYIDQVDLEPELQDWIFEYCDNRHISPCLVMAMIEQESECDPNCRYTTDTEDSIGLMQIQPRWHSDRMAELCVTDLTDPKLNVIVGVDYLLELFRKNPEVEWVLNAYNGGEAYADRMQEIGIVTDYSLQIMNRAKELEEYSYGNDERQIRKRA